MMLHTDYQGSRPYAFRQDFFSCCPYISTCRTCDPRGVAILVPGHILNKLGRDPLGDTTYQILWLKALWFQTRRFFTFFPI